MALEDRWIKTKRRRVAEKQGWLCHWCGQPMTEEPNTPMQVSLDHLVPKHNGGTTRPGNYVAAHRKCNSERHPELFRGKDADPVLVATTGEPASVSPFAVLQGRIKP
jgi:hypothetical protein